MKASLCKDCERRTSKKCTKHKVNGLTHMCRAVHAALAEQNLLSRWKSNRDPEEIISFPIIDTFYKTINSFCYILALYIMATLDSTIKIVRLKL